MLAEILHAVGDIGWSGRRQHSRGNKDDLARRLASAEKRCVDSCAALSEQQNILKDKLEESRKVNDAALEVMSLNLVDKDAPHRKLRE